MEEAKPMTALIDQVQTALAQSVSSLLKVRLTDIDLDAAFNEFGFDSILLTSFANLLNEDYGLELTPAIFFEHATLRRLASYLVRVHAEAVSSRFAVVKKAVGAPAPVELRLIGAPSARKRGGRRARARFVPETVPVAEERKSVGLEAVAVIGMSVRFPEAPDADAFWRNLLAGRDCISEVPASRWKLWSGWPGMAHLSEEDRARIRWGGFISGLDEFDPLFFGISPREAALMDPQQRLLMMHVWNAIEDAGYSARSLSGSRTAIFAGTGSSGYGDFVARAGEVDGYSSTGLTPSVGPNRISYLLNLHGPSEPIETACSSSLVAIHRGQLALSTGACDLAIVGGVNTIATPAFHVAFSKSGMLCADGRCKTFSPQANGYVRGEGVGMLVLKRLSEAERDGDAIYAVIRNSAVNHGGKSNSLTAPNPAAQSALLESVYEQAGIDPRTLGYIEAHGTGTSLGDAVETDALKTAFDHLYEKTQDRTAQPATNQAHCGLGSVKSNVGHLELAAGIAGVAKVLLQLKHRTLVQSLHCEEINPYIKLEGTPFYVVQKAGAWPALKTLDGTVLPRRAGVSSFGFGGANAHVVLEEYVATAPVSRGRVAGPLIFPISARDETRLQLRARQLRDALTTLGDEDLPNVAYTLQVGRDAMEARLGIIASSIAELSAELEAFLQGSSSATVYSGKIKRAGKFASTAENEQAAAVIDSCIASGDLPALLSLWIDGAEVDWRRLYSDVPPARVHLPGYPFAEERYWIESTAAVATPSSPRVATVLHPLVHESTSGGFSTTFTGQEFFLADHVVNDRHVLPGVAHLEMARVALQAKDSAAFAPARIRNVTWLRPIEVAGSPVQAHIELQPAQADAIAFKIHSKQGGSQVVHSQGWAEPLHADEERVDLASLRAEFSQPAMSIERYYGMLRASGLNLGVAFRAIQEINIAKGRVLSRIAPPHELMDSAAQFALHPSVIDAALQSTFGLLVSESGGDVAIRALPFALEALEVFAPCNVPLWASVRYSAGSNAASRIQKADIDLIDESGRVLAKLKGFSKRTLDPTPAAEQSLLVLQKTWLEAPATQAALRANAGTRHVVLCELGADTARQLEEIGATPIHLLQSTADDIAQRYQDHAQQLLKFLGDRLRESPGERRLVQLVVPASFVYRGLGAMLKTASQENTQFSGQLIAVDADCGAARLSELLIENAATDDAEIAYENGVRHVARWTEASQSPSAPAFDWMPRGVYLITGGAGQLGLLFAREIAERAQDARIILVGRSALRGEQKAELEAIKQRHGGEVAYYSLDVTDRAAVGELIERVTREHGRLNGVIHAAGIIDDAYLIKKTDEAAARVLSVKARGLVNLDEATRESPLDFFVAFSSLAGALGNVGQADYATGNAFMDCYMQHRHALFLMGQRRGTGVSINWPLWRTGGMNVDAATQELLRRNFGLMPLQTAEGVKAFHLALAGEHRQLVVASGDKDRLRRKLFGFEATAAPLQAEAARPTSDVPAGDNNELKEKVRAALVRSVSKLLKIGVERIDVHAELNKFGFDSLSLSEFGNLLNKEYQLQLAPTLFFEYPNIAAVSDYLIAEHRAVFEQRFGTAVSAAETSLKRAEPQPAAIAKVVSIQPSMAESGSGRSQSRSAATASEPIAIIGMSGRFPMARDLDEFWRNLAEGRDCISEIPASRWDWRAFWGDPTRETNKTNIKWGGFIEGIEEFDPLFFGISPREAELMDPAQRMLMTYAWLAIEDAGYSAQSLAGTKAAIFVGTASSGYGENVAAATSIESYTSIGSVPSMGPNRMSFFLNFTGPSQPIETACSSSLIALHRGMLALERDGCELALVGGVSALVVPGAHISFSKAGMLCEDGRCKTFSAQANGYVRGEGVGMLLLKRLSAAERDGDHIYGVILASAENHGGRANSLTAPNVKAQSELLETAYLRAGIDPRTVTYIEAHGTGTALGDPVEINGLKTAFRSLHDKTRAIASVEPPAATEAGPCGVGSVKSNIGHLEFAAGIAGVIKVLLQLKHKQLAKSLHCEQLNPYIQLQGSPFFIVQQTQPWQPLRDKSGNVLPRRAGVSSFGFGGANAHVVIEEHLGESMPRAAVEVSPQNPVAIVLSAKNEARLKDRARQLLEVVGAFTDTDLFDLAYTLQVGRDAMDERLGMIVSSVGELTEKLRGFLEGQTDLENVYRGRLKQHNDNLSVFALDDDLQEAIAKWLHRRKLGKLLSFWVDGLAVDWRQLYLDSKPRRLSLPGYPFSREHHWVDISRMQRAPALPAPVATPVAREAELHPLLQRNTSTLSEQRFSSIFDGTEFFLADHVISDRRVLPGVAYLEMVRAAMAQSLDEEFDDAVGIKIKNVVWIRPIIVGEQPQRFDLRLLPKDSGEVSFEVSSAASEGEQIVHSQGAVELGGVELCAPLDLAQLREECQQQRISGEECYAHFRAGGTIYGERLQAIEEILIGSGQALVKLRLPESARASATQFVLHPSLLDSAVQATIYFMDANISSAERGYGGKPRPTLPFAINELEVLAPCTEHMWASIRYSDGETAGVRKLDIDLSDSTGRMLVRMKEFSRRVFESEYYDAAMEVLLTRPVWKDKAALEEPGNFSAHHIALCGWGRKSERLQDELTRQFSASGGRVTALDVSATAETIARRYEDAAVALFSFVREILQQRLEAPVLLQLVIPAGAETQLLRGLGALLLSAQRESSHLAVQLVSMDATDEPRAIANRLREDANASTDQQIDYSFGQRRVLDWEEQTDASEQMPWREGGVYLITGGAGGLGMLLAQEIATQSRDATLVLTGRSAVDPARLEELRSRGAGVSYKQVRVEDADAVGKLIAEIEAELGGLNGVIHCAGTRQDALIVKKTEAQFREVLAAKVSGLVNLDEATAHCNLDVFLAFSSITGVLGNAGQADYAAANAFMDQYMQVREQRVAAGQRRGRSLSIDWSLWKHGGMQLDDTAKRLMAHHTGIAPMPTAVGLQALYRAIGTGLAQVMVQAGQLDQLKQNWVSIGKQDAPAPQALPKQVASSAPESRAQPRGDSASSLQQNILDWLVRSVSVLQKIPADDVSADAELSQFGFDSVSLIGFGNKLNDELALRLTPTVFFDYSTLSRFSEYLAKEYRDVFLAKFASEMSVAPRAAPVPEQRPAEATVLAPKRARSNVSRAVARPVAPSPSPAAVVERTVPGTPVLEPLAIIGMSCRFPQAEDVDAFWRNLEQGRDCISEIPPLRWDWRAVWGDPRKEANKSNIKWGGFIDGLDEFDALFFGISPREAEGMDPQQRLLMSAVWQAIEDAGYSAQSLAGSRTAIFAGTANSGYADLVARANLPVEGYSSTGAIASLGPNRMSFFLNVHGPSEAIDTACSSSLVAVHRAHVAISMGTCDMAVVGGVNTIVSREAQLAFNKAGMLCEDGRCKTFSSQANGYVRGEGVGMLVLKKLSAAERDGDHIYGVVRGSAENHGGRANSLTAPNPKAQAALIEAAYTSSGIDARTVTYIEAHGTGTELGDPIEIEGLRGAFNSLYEKSAGTSLVPPGTERCGLASVKSNIGHLELAAGVAGVIKVLLQMKHRTLVKSLNCEPLNPYIRLEGSPFYIVTENQPWTALSDTRGQPLPRRAGVSSFGFGGANAHVVIEEYVPREREPEQRSHRPVAIVLSAKDGERLNERATQLLRAIEQQRYSDDDLESLAYTLQVGRDAMDWRLGMVASSLAEVAEKLRAALREDTAGEPIYRGHAKRDRDALNVFSADEELQEAIDKWLGRGKLGKLVALWVKGLPFDWRRLYGDMKPRRLSVPAYPFAKQRCWVSTDPGASSDRVGAGEGTVLHPLAHRNSSDLSEQRFTSTFTAREFFLADHIVNDSHVLPGVAHLEMARAALEHSMSDPPERCVRLKQVNWIRTVVVEKSSPAEVHIGLHPQSAGEIEFQIYGTGSDLFSQGRLEYVANPGVPDIDVGALQDRCSRTHLDATACYRLLREFGLNLGPAMQGIETVQASEDEVLAKLRVPAVVASSFNDYFLHPSLMDSALQSTLGLLADRQTQAPKPGLPFALEQVDIIAPCTARMWAWIRRSAGCQPSDKVQKLDIDLGDENGKVCVRMQGFSMRLLDGERVSTDEADAKMGEVALTSIPVWEPTPVERASLGLGDARSVVALVTGMQEATIARLLPSARIVRLQQQATVEQLTEALRASGEIDHLLWVGAGASEQPALAIHVFRLVKALLALGYGERGLDWTTITCSAEVIAPTATVDPDQASVHGLLGSLAKEYPNWRLRVVDVSKDRDVADAWNDIRALPADPLGNAWVYRGGEWFRQRWIAVDDPAVHGKAEPVGFRKNGVYVIVGGAGGIGEVFSEYLIRNYAANVAWIGRRASNAAVEAKQARLGALGPRPEYFVADAAEEEDLQRAYEAIKARYGAVHGVIHSAIELLDQRISHLDEQRFVAALRAQRDVCVQLAKVFAAEPLELVLLFSSIQSFVRAAGQSNYSAGCMFKDAFGRQWARSASCDVRTINWGYWGSVGVVASPEYRSRMAQQGIGSIEPAEAMRAIEWMLSRSLSQMVFVKTSRPEVFVGGEGRERVVALDSALPSLIGESGVARSLVQVDPAPGADDLQSTLARILFAQLSAANLLGPAPTAKPLAIYDKWLSESLRMLERDGQLTGAASISTDALWLEWEACKQQWLRNPRLAAQVKLLDVTLRALPDILLGKQPATDVLFPNSSFVLVEGMYRDNPVAATCNALLADAVTRFIERRLQRSPGARIRILEIGAGTGSTSAAVLPKLKPFTASVEEYCYTDISTAFLQHAEQSYSELAPYLTTRLFDVDRAPEAQGLKLGAYDIVIASNVLHATPNIRRTVRNAKALLKSHGWLLLNEVSSHTLVAHLTFGLLEGWWRYEDPALRIPGSPALSPEQWQYVLATEGFRNATFLTSASLQRDQQLIVAESDGVIRRQVAIAPVVSSSEPRIPSARPSLPEPKRAVVAEAGSLRDRAITAVKALVGEALKVPVKQLSSTEPFESYGIDSIVAVRLTNDLQRFFPNLASTVFFEFQTIEALVDHFLRTHHDALVALTGPAAAPVEVQRAAPVVAAPVRFRSRPAVEVAARPASREEARQDAIVTNDAIAIIGMSGRFPQARDIDQLWRNLSAGDIGITEVPSSRWDWRAIAKQHHLDTQATGLRWGGFVDGIDEFDPLLFGISPREAKGIDPQQRLLLQSVYATLNDAGYTSSDLTRHTTGVFIASVPSGYERLASEADADVALLGASASMAASRISHAFNLQGPSELTDTACSSVFVALNRAVRALRAGECEMAIVGGANLLVQPDASVGFASLGYLSPSGRCRSFQEGADGYVRSECVGTFLLKPLHQAEADGDMIHAVVKGTGVHHGGRGLSLTAPSVTGMRAAMIQAYRSAAIEPADVQYIEAHGIAAALGDAVEMQAFKSAFDELSGATRGDTPCFIGSLKPNLGHAEVASGVAALAKVIMALKTRTLPGMRQEARLSEQVSLSGTAFAIADRSREWPAPFAGKPRVASLNSYGFGGVNAHVVLEEYVSPASAPADDVQAEAHVIVLSARTPEQLRQLAGSMSNHLLASSQGMQLRNIAFSLQTGREALDCRLAFVAETVVGCQQTLAAFSNDPDGPGAWYFGTLTESAEDVAPAIDDPRAAQAQELARAWTRGAKIAWHRLYDPKRVSKVRLPAYPFATERYWISNLRPQPTQEESVPTPAPSASPLRVIVADLLGMEVAAVPAGMSLSRLGFNSIQAMALRTRLAQTHGIDVPMHVLGEANTLHALERELESLFGSKQESRQREHAPTIAVAPDLASRHLPFPLSDIQSSYLAGRRLRLGQDAAGCHIYFEVETGGLDIYRLNAAWRRLVEHHDMLRAVILASGEQQIQQVAPAFAIRTLDWENCSDVELEGRRLELRESMSHKVYGAGEWPLFDIRVAVLPEGRGLLFFSIDELIVDATGLTRLLSQWQELYANPSMQLTPLEFSYRDYVLSLQMQEQTPRVREDLAYWIGELGNIGESPSANNAHAGGTRVRLDGALEEPKWSALKQRAMEFGVSPTTLLLAAFAEVLHLWDRRERFPIILTVFDRPPLHPMINEVVGPFISTSLLAVTRSDGTTLADAAKRLQRRLWDNLDHGGVSGIRVLRELRSKGKIPRGFSIPVVFTSLLSLPDQSQLPSLFDGDVTFALTQTPQVYLDHQVGEQQGRLIYSWDVVEDYFGADIVRGLFADYGSILDALTSDDGATLVISRPALAAEVPRTKQGFKLSADPANAFEPFPLTDQQMAYAYARRRTPDNVPEGCQFYQEIDAKNLDLPRLERALEKLIEAHPMLRAVLSSKGNQRVLKRRDYSIDVADLRSLSVPASESALLETRRDMTHRVFALDNGPYFDLKVSRTGATSARIHFCIDLSIADATSIAQLFKQLFLCYRTPEMTIDPPAVSFRDYVQSEKKFLRSAGAAEHVSYWERKFAGLKGGPTLPKSAQVDSGAKQEHLRITGTLKEWAAIKQHARRWSIEPGTVLLTAYASVLAHWSGAEDFSIVVPRWERLPVHEQIDAVVGDFTTLNWVRVSGEAASFIERARDIQAQLDQDFTHRAVSGLTVLRKLGRAAPAFPVVFTGMTTTLPSDVFPDGFEPGVAISKTPQVHLDNISTERGSELVLNWDVSRGACCVSSAQEMFSGYRCLLETLARDEMQWERDVAGVIGAPARNVRVETAA